MVKMMYSLFSLICLFLVVSQASADVIDRLTILDDRFKTQEMLRPLGHDFYFDISAAMNTDSQDFVDDLEGLGDLTGTDSEKVTQATEILNPYLNTEQFLRIRLGLGIPIFSFSMFGVRVEPNFRVDAGVTGAISIQEDTLSLTDLPNLLASSVPAEIKTAIANCSGLAGIVVNEGDNIIVLLEGAGCINSSQAAVLTGIYGGSLVVPAGIETGVTVPVADIYIKGDAKIGFFADLNKNHWFGNVGFYGLGRADIRRALTVEQFVFNTDTEVIDMGAELNTTVNLAADLKFGYKNANYSIAASAEEIHLAELSENKAGTEKPAFGENLLFRLHADYTFRLWIFQARGFVGSHARSGYGFGDAYYAGVDWGGYVWGNRLGCNLRTMVDKEHFTFAPRFKLWLMHLEYTLKTPLKSSIDGVKPSTIHMLNFRAFI